MRAPDLDSAGGLTAQELAAPGASARRRSELFTLYAARAARGLGDGFAAIILPAYLIEIGFNPFEIGVVAAAALAGSRSGYWRRATICARCCSPARC
jgi:hypothetical protein